MKKYFPIAGLGVLGLGLVLSIIVSQKPTQTQQHASTTTIVTSTTRNTTEGIQPVITGIIPSGFPCLPIAPTCFPGIICPQFRICATPTPTPIQSGPTPTLTPTPFPICGGACFPINASGTDGNGNSLICYGNGSLPTWANPFCPLIPNCLCPTPTPTLSVASPTPTPNQNNTPTPTTGSTGSPSPTISGSPTPVSTASIQISFSVLGIPDSSNSAIPLHQTRAGSIDFVDANNTSHPINTTFQFDNTNGIFTTTVQAAVAPGIYLPKIDVPGYLHKALPLVTITQTSATPNTYSAAVVNGDIDADNSLDILDFQALFNCYNTTVAARPECAASDLNDDGNIDAVDFNIFLRSFSTQHGD